MSNGQSLLYGAGTVKRVFGFAASLGDNLIVAAVTGKRIRVLAYYLSSGDTVNAGFQDADGAIGGLHVLSLAGGQVVLPYLEVGWAETKKSSRLDLNLSAAVAALYHVLYVEVN